MDIRKLQRAIVDGLEDVKAHDIQVFNTEHMTPLFERVVVASGTSNRQTKALASSVRDAVRSRGFSVMRTEGEDNGEWIIVDCGAAVVHIMQPAIRLYYHLEELWGGKSVKMKMNDGAARSLPKAEEADDEAPARRPVAKKAAGKSGALSAAKKLATQGARGATATKPAGPKTPARGPSSSRPPAAKKAAARSTAAGKTAARKAAGGAGRQPVVKTVIVKAPARTGSAARGASTAAKTATKPAAKTSGKPAGKTSTRAPRGRA